MFFLLVRNKNIHTKPSLNFCVQGFAVVVVTELGNKPGAGVGVDGAHVTTHT